MDVKEEITRREVVQAASRLFQRYGLVKTTMEDIARETGRGKSTLYYYFKSKDEIFDAVVNQELQEALEAIETAISHCTSATDKIRAFINTTTETLRSKANLYSIAKGELRENPRLLEALKSSLDLREMELVASIIRLGVERGEFKQGLLREAGMFSFLLVSTLRSLSLEILTSERSQSPEESFQLLSDVLLNGISNSMNQ